MNFKAFQGWRAGTETRFPSLLLDTIESLATQDFLLSSKIVTAGGGYPRVGTRGRPPTIYQTVWPGRS